MIKCLKAIKTSIVNNLKIYLIVGGIIFLFGSYFLFFRIVSYSKNITTCSISDSFGICKYCKVIICTIPKSSEFSDSFCHICKKKTNTINAQYEFLNKSKDYGWVGGTCEQCGRIFNIGLYINRKSNGIRKILCPYCGKNQNLRMAFKRWEYDMEKADEARIEANRRIMLEKILPDLP